MERDAPTVEAMATSWADERVSDEEDQQLYLKAYGLPAYPYDLAADVQLQALTGQYSYWGSRSSGVQAIWLLGISLGDISEEQAHAVVQDILSDVGLWQHVQSLLFVKRSGSLAGPVQVVFRDSQLASALVTSVINGETRVFANVLTDSNEVVFGTALALADPGDPQIPAADAHELDVSVEFKGTDILQKPTDVALYAFLLTQRQLALDAIAAAGGSHTGVDFSAAIALQFHTGQFFIPNHRAFAIAQLCLPQFVERAIRLPEFTLQLPHFGTVTVVIRKLSARPQLPLISEQFAHPVVLTARGVANFICVTRRCLPSALRGRQYQLTGSELNSLIAQFNEAAGTRLTLADVRQLRQRSNGSPYLLLNLPDVATLQRLLALQPKGVITSTSAYLQLRAFAQPNQQ